MNATTRITKKDGEYRARIFIDGIYQPGGDYFTDDYIDAQITAKHMREHASPTDKTSETAIQEQLDYEQENI